MYSLINIVALSLVLGSCILVVDFRPSFAMPIDGDKSSDNYQDMYNLITQRLQNLTQVNEENGQTIRRTFISNKTADNAVNETSLARNTSHANNTTVPSRNSNSTQMNLTKDENSRRSYVPMTAGYTGNLIARKSVTGTAQRANILAGNQPVSYPMAGNQPMSNPMAGNQPVSDAVAGTSLFANQSPGNQMAGNSPMGNSHEGNLPVGNPWTQNSMAGNKPVANLLTGNPAQAGNSQVLTSTEQAGASMFSSSLNAGRTFPEDRSGIYTNLHRQPSTYEKKDTVFRQSSPAYGHSTTLNYGQGNVNGYERFSTPSSDVRKTNVFTPGENTRGYQNYQQIGNFPTWAQYTGYPGYTGYPDFQQQPVRRGYLAKPGYQAGYPRLLQQRKRGRHSATKRVRDRVPADNKTSKVNDQYPTTAVSPNTDPIQIKLPTKPAPSPDNIADESSSSDSGSGPDFDEPVDMENTADFQEPQELSGSGSGDENEYLNVNTVSDVAFMLAGTNHKPPLFPAPGLPMNLTRQQALDIYKSAMYFAGLMKEDNLDSDSEQSGDDQFDDDEDSDRSFPDEDDDNDDLTLTDTDVKEALAASSGELDSSDQEVGDAVEDSESKSGAPANLVHNKDNDESEAQKQSGELSKDENEAPKSDNEAPKSDNDAPKSDNEVQKQASEPQMEDNKSQPKESSPSRDDSATPKEEKDTPASNDESQAPKKESNAQKEQSQPEEVEAKEDVHAQTPPPVDSEAGKVSNDKQASDSAEEDLDTPPPDETLMKETQTNYAADQQAEQALYYLHNTRVRGTYSAPSQRTVICKGTTQRISCPPDQRIRILNADYGDTGNFGCLKEANPMPSGPCRTPGAYETVKRDCEGFEDCDLSSSNDVFGDACPDANKYLDVNYDCVNNAVPYAPPVPGYSQASYHPAPQYVNPAPPPVAYAPAPYQAPPPPPAMGLPDMLPPSPYIAPDPCNPCNTCAQCSLPVCGPCSQTCHSLTCPPRIPAKLQPLWQQWNERTADMSRMEMAALIISPVPKLSPKKEPETTESSGAAEGSESGEPTLDEDALYEASKRSEIQRIKPQQKSKKTTLAAHKKNDNDQGFFRNSDSMVSSGDASSGSST